SSTHFPPGGSATCRCPRRRSASGMRSRNAHCRRAVADGRISGKGPLQMCRVVILVALALFASMSSPVQAQDYPSRPIHIVVGSPPGAGVDFTARLFADALQAALHQPAIVENRAGTGGEIAAEYVAHAVP